MGKSEISLFLTAKANANQLWNDGSLILYKISSPLLSVIAQWQISPRHPSTNESVKEFGFGVLSLKGFVLGSGIFLINLRT
jgi:hypothetical protein